MRIAEFCRRSGLPRDTVRFYERRGLLRPAIGSNRYRDYAESDLARVRMIRIGQLLGFSLREIVALGRAWDRNALGPEAQLRALRARREDLDARLAELAQARRYVAAKIAWLEAGGVGSGPEFDLARVAAPRQVRRSPAAAPRRQRSAGAAR